LVLCAATPPKNRYECVIHNISRAATSGNSFKATISLNMTPKKQDHVIVIQLETVIRNTGIKLG